MTDTQNTEQELTQNSEVLPQSFILLTHLYQGEVVVVFTKKDGTERTMRCTLSKSYIPVTPVVISETPLPDAISASRKKNPAVQVVWDIEASAWRSFRWDSIVSFYAQATQSTENQNV